jgi:hypothetical protein
MHLVDMTVVNVLFLIHVYIVLWFKSSHKSPLDVIREKISHPRKVTRVLCSTFKKGLPILRKTITASFYPIYESTVHELTDMVCEGSFAEFILLKKLREVLRPIYKQNQQAKSFPIRRYSQEFQNAAPESEKKRLKLKAAFFSVQW